MEGNGELTAQDARGGGDSELISATRPIPDIKLLRRAILHQWAIPAHIYATLPQACIDILNGADGTREKLAAIKLLTTMHKDNVDAFVQVDKMDRLETGQATERYELKPVVFERRD